MPRVCETGGALGKAADFDARLGIERNVCRASIRSATEPMSDTEGIDLVFAPEVGGRGATISTDAALNCIAFPQMDDAICADNLSRLPRWTPLLLNINQEANRPVRGLRSRQQM